MTQDELVRSLLGLATEGVHDPSEEYRIHDITSAAVRPIEWLWEGYILKNQLTLFDAKGGSGKTRFLLSLAAAGSIGTLPFGPTPEPVKIEPFKTLVFSSEDDAGDLRHVYEGLGGDPAYLAVWDPTHRGQFQLDDEGLYKLEAIIKVNNYQLVAFDPILEYLGPNVKSQMDNIGITKTLAGLRGVAQRTGASIVQVRHFSAASIGKEVNNMGAGGEAWRNASRGQFVLFPHPSNGDNPSLFRVLVVPARATLRTILAKPFEMVIEDGRQTFVPPDRIDLEPYGERYESIKRMFNMDKEEEQKPKRGPGAGQVEGAKRFILNAVALQPRHWSTLREEAELSGFKQRSFYSAKTALIEEGLIEEVSGVLRPLVEVDPFAD